MKVDGGRPATELVEAEGHLIDSQLLNAMFDTVVRHDAAFDVLEFRMEELLRAGRGAHGRAH